MAERRDIERLEGDLAVELSEAQLARKPQDSIWEEDWRAYKGIYDPEVSLRMQKRKDRSQVFYRKTKVKTDTVAARLLDVLFPRSGAANWEIKATPIPQFDSATEKRLQVAAISPGADLAALRAEEAEARTRAMTVAMADSLADMPDQERGHRLGYRAVMREVIMSAVKYGTGILKGPLVEPDRRQVWRPGVKAVTGPDGLTRQEDFWGMQVQDNGYRPSIRPVSVWNWWPEPAARAWPGGCRYEWEGYLMTVSDLYELAARPSFDRKVIDRYLRDNKGGDATETEYEKTLRRASEGRGAQELKDRYRVYERWGYLRRRDWEMVAGALDDDSVDEVFCNLWTLGGKIIKAVRQPLQGVKHPYFIFQFEPDEGGLLHAAGIPRIMRDPQVAINAAFRASLDNAAATSGPLVGINRAALQNTEDATRLTPYSIKLFDTADDLDKAMRVWTIPSSIRETQLIISLCDQFGDELTTPRFVHGEGKVTGSDAAKTATGLSILMGNLSVNLQESIKQIDDTLIAPFITALYHWHMNFNPDPAIKGDYRICALGSSSLVAKEMRAQQLMQFMQVSDQERYQGRVDDAKVLRRWAEAADIPEDLVRTDEEYAAWRAEEMALAAQAQAQGQVRAVLAEMQQLGVSPQDALARMAARMLPGAGESGAQVALPPGQEPAMQGALP